MGLHSHAARCARFSSSRPSRRSADTTARFCSSVRTDTTCTSRSAEPRPRQSDGSRRSATTPNWAVSGLRVSSAVCSGEHACARVCVCGTMCVWCRVRWSFPKKCEKSCRACQKVSEVNQITACNRHSVEHIHGARCVPVPAGRGLPCSPPGGIPVAGPHGGSTHTHGGQGIWAIQSQAYQVPCHGPCQSSLRGTLRGSRRTCDNFKTNRRQTGKGLEPGVPRDPHPWI